MRLGLIPFFAKGVLPKYSTMWDRSITPDGVAIENCALLTMPGNDLMRRVHNTGPNPFRMQAILAQPDQHPWAERNEGAGEGGSQTIPRRCDARLSGQYPRQQSKKQRRQAHPACGAGYGLRHRLEKMRLSAYE